MPAHTANSNGKRRPNGNGSRRGVRTGSLGSSREESRSNSRNGSPNGTGRRAHAPHFDSPHQEAFLSLWRTYDRLRAHEDELFQRHDLTAQQYNALRLLRAAHPRKVPTLSIATRLISRAPDITRLLDRLAERGLVERERLPDNRRVVQVGITEAGLALLDEMADQVRACHARQLGHLDPAELSTLVDLLRKARTPHEPEVSTWR